MTKLAKLVRSAMLVGNDLWINASKTALAEGLSVEAQGQMIALAAVDDVDNMLADLPMRRTFAFPTDVTLSEPTEEGADITSNSEGHVNLLSDWALENGQTLQIRIDAADQPRLIEIAHPLKVPASNQNLQFEAYVAGHRCKASLVVSFAPLKRGVAEDVVVKLDPRFSGGRQTDGYQKIVVPVPRSKSAQNVTLAIKYDGYRPDGTDNYPYFFIGNARVVTPALKPNSLHPRQSPIADTTAGTTQDEWLRAHVPLSRSGDDAPLTLKLGKEGQPLFPSIENSNKRDSTSKAIRSVVDQAAASKMAVSLSQSSTRCALCARATSPRARYQGRSTCTAKVAMRLAVSGPSGAAPKAASQAASIAATASSLPPCCGMVGARLTAKARKALASVGSSGIGTISDAASALSP